jgi:hypothetical protein
VLRGPIKQPTRAIAKVSYTRIFLIKHDGCHRPIRSACI